MSYKNIVLVSCADKKEFFCRMRDFLCQRNGTYDYSTTGIGWTLHDSSYAADEDNPAVNDWIVIKSTGENGKEDIYLQIKWTTNGISVYGWLYWNNSTHAGVHQYGSSSSMTVAESGSYELSVYGDLSFIIIIESSNTTYDYLAYAGCVINQVYDNTVAISAGALSSGSDVTISLDAVPASWYVGQRIFIRDDAGIDIITIKSISGNDITADLSSNYAAGCKLRADFPYVVNNIATSMNGYAMIGHNSTVALSYSAVYNTNYQTSADPDALNADYFGAPIDLAGTDSYFGQLPHVWTVSSTGLTEKAAFDNGYRFFKIYTSFYLAIEEV